MLSIQTKFIAAFCMVLMFMALAVPVAFTDERCRVKLHAETFNTLGERAWADTPGSIWVDVYYEGDPNKHRIPMTPEHRYKTGRYVACIDSVAENTRKGKKPTFVLNAIINATHAVAVRTSSAGPSIYQGFGWEPSWLAQRERLEQGAK